MATNALAPNLQRKTNRTKTSLLLLSCMVIGSMAGCDETNEPDAGDAYLELVTPKEVADSPVVVLEPDEVPLVARIDGEQEGMIDFFDLSEISGADEIIVVAVGPEGGAVSKFLDEGASPLEVYLALAPVLAAPARMVEHHASLAGEGLVPDAPRKLQVLRATNVGDDCVNGGGVGAPFAWWEAWRSGYGSTSGHQLFSSSSTFHSGTAITVYNSTRRALEACAWDHRSELHTVSFQTLSGGVWWQLGSYTRPGDYPAWGVATRSISSSGTLSARFVVTNQWGSGTIAWFFWGGALSA